MTVKHEHTKKGTSAFLNLNCQSHVFTTETPSDSDHKKKKKKKDDDPDRKKKKKDKKKKKVNWSYYGLHMTVQITIGLNL